MGYPILGRGGIALHFIAAPDVDPLATAASCFVYVADAGKLHREWHAAGVAHDPDTGSRLEPLVDTDYGMREFALVDTSGNVVRVGSTRLGTPRPSAGPGREGGRAPSRTPNGAAATPVSFASPSRRTAWTKGEPRPCLPAAPPRTRSRAGSPGTSGRAAIVHA